MSPYANFAFLILLVVPVPAFDFMDAAEFAKFAAETVHDALEAWEFVKPRNHSGAEDDESSLPITRRKEKRLLNEINRIAFKRLDQIEQRFEKRFDNLESIIRDIPEQARFENRKNELEELLNRVDYKFGKFQLYANQSQDLERWTLEDFAKSNVGFDVWALPHVLQRIHELFVTNGDDLVELLARQLKEASKAICDSKQSPQQLLYNLYNTVALTEMRGYLMMQYSYTLLRIHSKQNYTREMENARQDYAQRISDTLRHVKLAMAYAPREILRCDPEQHVEDSTFTELKEVFQGYIVNEVDLNSRDTCRETCAYYSYTRVHTCYANQYCAQQKRCQGKILNCQFVKSDMTICSADKDSGKRYQYIEYENGRVLGKKTRSCPARSAVNSWWRWLFWHCSYCFCTCDDETPNSDRYFNLREVNSNIAENKIVTGVRFQKKNHVIHIQIQESTLLPKGKINESSSSWKPIENYTIHDENMKNGIDFHTMIWEKRAIDLDDLEPSSDSQLLLTGLKFRVIGAHLNLEIRTTAFNFTTGKLFVEKTHWHSNDNTDADASGRTSAARSEVTLKYPDVPTSRGTSFPDSKSNQYLHFQPTDMDQDAAQSTVPFLDIQPVVPSPPTPISGAGIYHKGRDGSGGFVALKLMTYDFAKHLKSELPETPEPTQVVGLSNDIYAV